MKKRVVIIISAVVVLVALVVFKLAHNVKTVQDKVYVPENNKSVLVKTYKTVKKSLNYEYKYMGTFLPNREIMLVPQAQGEVKGVFFNEGDIVNQGKVLLQIDDAFLQSQYIAARASFDIAQTNYERFKNASVSEGISKIQVDNNWLQLKSAESQLKQLETGIQKCKLIAPFDGTITYRNVESGSVIGISPIGRLTDISLLKVEISVPESDISYLHFGDIVDIQSVIFPGEIFHGTIVFVSDRGDDSHNYIVKVNVTNNNKVKLKAGMYALVTLNKELNISSINIPRDALLGSAKNPQVYIVENGKAVLKNIVTGRSNGLEIEVLKGIGEEEMVVTSGLINLVDGSLVEIAR